MIGDLNPSTPAEHAAIAWAEDCDLDEAAFDVLVQDLIQAADYADEDSPVSAFRTVRRALKAAIVLGRRALADYQTALRALCESEADHQKAATAPVVPQEGTEAPAGQQDAPETDWEQAETLSEAFILLRRLQFGRETDPRPWTEKAKDGYLTLFYDGATFAVVFSGCASGVTLAQRVLGSFGWRLILTTQSADVPAALHDAHLRGQALIKTLEVTSR